MEDRIVWRRIDRAGIDNCVILHDEAGWSVTGAATGCGVHAPYQLSYAIQCDSDWHTRQAQVRGWAAGRQVALDADRDGDLCWRVNGRHRPDLDGAVDIDLGFTPTTNTVAIRRLALHPDTDSFSLAAWFDEADWKMKPLRQGYRRIGRSCYRYLSPDNGFEAELEMKESGLVLDYPGLWQAIDRESTLSKSRS